MEQFSQFTDELERLIHVLASEVYLGSAHLYIGRHLTNALIQRPMAAKTANTFFSLTLHAHMVEAFLHLARLFDKRASTMKLETLLELAEINAGRFATVDAEHARKLIQRHRELIDELNGKVRPVLERRNKLLAHLDPTAVLNLSAFEKEATITFGEMETLYEKSGEIINEIYGAYKNGQILMDILGRDDFTRLLNLFDREQTRDT